MSRPHFGVLFRALAVGMILAGAQPAEASATPTPGKPPVLAAALKPNLVVDAPKWDHLGFTATVRNIGSADAHSSRLSWSCEAIFPGKDFHCGRATTWVDVPPIPRGGSFQTPPQQLTSAVPPSRPPAGPPYYRFRITARADADGKVAEGNETNNKAILMIENFQGSQPPSPAPVAFQVAIEPEVPIVFPYSKDWILVRNKGTEDYPGGTATVVECEVVSQGGTSNCDFYYGGVMQWIRGKKPFAVGPIKAGSFQALFELPAIASSVHPPDMKLILHVNLETKGGGFQNFKIQSK